MNSAAEGNFGFDSEQLSRDPQMVTVGSIDVSNRCKEGGRMSLIGTTIENKNGHPPNPRRVASERGIWAQNAPQMRPIFSG